MGQGDASNKGSANLGRVGKQRAPAERSGMADLAYTHMHALDAWAPSAPAPHSLVQEGHPETDHALLQALPQRLRKQGQGRAWCFMRRPSGLRADGPLSQRAWAFESMGLGYVNGWAFERTGL